MSACPQSLHKHTHRGPSSLRAFSPDTPHGGTPPLSGSSLLPMVGVYVHSPFQQRRLDSDPLPVPSHTGQNETSLSFLKKDRNETQGDFDGPNLVHHRNLVLEICVLTLLLEMIHERSFEESLKIWAKPIGGNRTH